MTPPAAPAPTARAGTSGTAWRRVAILAAVGAFLVHLGLDEAGRPSYASRPAMPVKLGEQAVLTIEAPAGTYDAFVRLRVLGTLRRLTVSGLGEIRERRDVRGAHLWGAADIPVGRFVHAGGEVTLRIDSTPVRGDVLRFVLEPAPPLPLTRDAGQRIAFAVAAGLTLAALWRRPILLVVVLATALLARLPIHGLVPFVGGDMRAAFFPWHVLSCREIAAGRIPLWNPHAFLGLPHLANIQTQVFYPPVMLLLALGASFPLRELALTWAQSILAAAGMFTLARGLRFSRAAALTCGLLFTLGPALLNPEHGPILSVVALTPWLLATQVWGRPRALAGIWALAVLAGHLQYLGYAAIALAIIVVVPPERRRMSPFTTAAALAIGSIASAALLLPFAEYASLSTRSRGLTPEHAALGAYDPVHALHALQTGFGVRHVARPPSARACGAELVGLVGLPLVAAGLAEIRSRRRGRPVRTLLLLLLVGASLALGSFAPWSPAAILGYFPLFAAQRGAARATVICQLALPLLAAAGVDRLRLARRRSLLVVAPIAAGTAIVLAAAVSTQLVADLDPAVRAGIPWQLALASLPVVPALLPRRRRRAALAILLGAGIVDRVDDAWSMRSGNFASAYRAHASSSSAPKQGTREVLLGPFTPNDAVLVGRRSAWGYDPVIPRRTATLWNAVHPDIHWFDTAGRLANLGPRLEGPELLAPRGLDVMKAMGVSRLAVPPGAIANAPPGLVRDRRGGRHGRELEIPGARRARLVHEIRSAGSPAEAAEITGAGGPGAQLMDAHRELRAASEHVSIRPPRTVSPPRQIVLDSFLGGGRSIPTGTAVGRIQVFQGSRTLLDAPLRAGIETADMELEDPGQDTFVAHGKADVASAHPLTRGGATFQIYIFRASFPLPDGSHPDRIEVTRPEGAFRLYVKQLRFPSVEPSLWPAVVEGPSVALRGPPPVASEARVTDVSPLRVDVEIAPPSAAPGYLLLSDAWYPGWRASVDGRPAPIHPASVALRAVPVGAGARRVVFAYEPFSFRLGLFLSGLAILVMAAVPLLDARGRPCHR